MAELRISGSGSLNSGNEYYDFVGISGSGKITGDLNCKELRISGSGKIDGSVNCDGEIRISGSGKVVGGDKAVSVLTSGSSKFENNVKCDNFKVSGATSVLGDVDCQYMHVSGEGSFANVSASEEAAISGAAKVTGLLNAESVTISLGGVCNINEIGCTNLSVKRRHGDGSSSVKIFNFTVFSISRGGGKNSLIAGTVEGDDIDIEYTTAEVVRGAKVIIGKGCSIGKVEYTESLTVDESSEVKEKIKL